MNTSHSENWWMIALKGFLAFILGSLALFFPVESLKILLQYIGFLIGLGGVFVLLFSSKVESSLKKWFIVEGIFDLLLALLMVFYPQKTAWVVALLLGIWLIINGFFQIILSDSYRKAQIAWKMRLANGIITLVLGWAICLHPITGIVSLALLFGITSVLFGIFLMITAFGLRQHPMNIN